MKIRYNTETFIKKAKEIHGNKYNYDKCIFKTLNDKVIITCPKHSDFEQKAMHHIDGRGCRKCAAELRNKNNNSTTEEFIAKAILKHGNKYDYSKVDYKNSKAKVEIICPIHGSFIQSAENHLSGHGCPKCAKNNN